MSHKLKEGDYWMPKINIYQLTSCASTYGGLPEGRARQDYLVSGYKTACRDT
eukprot:CAMPEP_0177621742 /NCGR_PEP_ID=MMETSP0419_2-20121207/27760_1 /TAXON_ID=582737 /ORGANISM="Tetraselmis sp., Strain GSL018" /LENGTH=51 /DNA_ID=CAMNT_0019121705 /DNA_START=33 /DNA_END=188 /DNA_ORIENTATION=-